MLIISHRGNLNGPSERENNPRFIDEILSFGFDCEIDIWFESNALKLGHDYGAYEIDLNWLVERKGRLWIHCKNYLALELMNESRHLNLNYFWHGSDSYTITSLKKVWIYPGMSVFPNTVAVLPEKWKKSFKTFNLKSCYAICTDFPLEFKKYFDPNI
jgi:hypothetical protein